MTKGHYHWLFRAANTGQIDPVEVSVLGYLSETTALAAMEELVVRDTYTLLRVFECNTCAYQQDMTETLGKFLK